MSETEAAGLIQDDEEPLAVDLGRLKQATARDYAIRFGFGFGFGFGAAISAIAALAGIRFKPLVGGLFLAFPAILPATLTLLEKKEGKIKACADASGGILGAFGLGAFAAVASVLLRVTHPAIALAAALLAWALVAVGLYFALRMTNWYQKEDRLLRKAE